jgi:hypothetical protein
VRSLGPKRSRKTNVFPPLVLVLKIAPDGSLGCTSHLSRESFKLFLNLIIKIIVPLIYVVCHNYKSFFIV